MKSTPIATMQKTAGVEPLDSRRNAKLLTHEEKVKRMPDHPLHKHLQNLTKKRLKRTSLNHVLKEQQRKESDILAPRPEDRNSPYQASAPSQATVKPLSKH